MADRLARFKAYAQALDVPVLYVNDNFGRWQSDFRRLVAHCLGDCCGRPVVERVRPSDDDYFVLKPKHARSVILTVLTTDNCVLFTASNAYLRDFELIV